MSDIWHRLDPRHPIHGPQVNLQTLDKVYRFIAHGNSTKCGIIEVE